MLYEFFDASWHSELGAIWPRGIWLKRLGKQKWGYFGQVTIDIVLGPRIEE
jgi:hypothetical protein